MSASRVSFVPSTIITTATAALAGSNGAVTFLNKPFAGQPSTLSSTATFKVALPRSSTSGQGSQLDSININYSIEDSNINTVTVSLSTQSFGPGSTITPIPTTPSGFTLTPGNYTGMITIDTPSYANSAYPEYYLLDVTVVVGTGVVTELRINDIEFVYTVNAGDSFPSNVHIPGYMDVGATTEGYGITPQSGDIRCERLAVGAYGQNFSTETGLSAIFGGNVPVNAAMTYNYVLTSNIYNSTPATGTVYGLTSVMQTPRTSYKVTGANSGTFSSIYGDFEHYANSSIAQIRGVTGLVVVSNDFQSPSTVTEARGMYTSTVIPDSLCTGIVTNTEGLFVGGVDPLNLTVPNMRGIWVGPMITNSSVSTCVGVQIDLPATSSGVNSALYLSDGTGVIRGGIKFSSDCSIYRSSANTLDISNQTLRVGSSTAGIFQLVGGATPVFRVTGPAADVGMNLITQGNSGLNFYQNSGAGNQMFSIVSSASTTVNFLSVVAGTASNPARLNAGGADTDVDLMLGMKGNGRLRVSYSSTIAGTPASFTATRYLPIKDGSGTTYYIPLALAPW